MRAFAAPSRSIGPLPRATTGTRPYSGLSAARRNRSPEASESSGRVGPSGLALAYTGQGNLTRGFAYLDSAIAARDIFLPEDFFDPQLDALRADPRFAAREQKMHVRRRGK